jgi:protein O-mannosyl-transferase
MSHKIKKTEATKSTYIFIAILALSSILPFLTLLSADFVHWDDDVYITANEKVLKGMTFENIKWAFSTIFFGFYFPVTWLSHMLDISIYGLKPWGHHLTSILIHAANSLLLFFFLKRSALDEARSFTIAAFFAVHPLNVESVAWISERKNLLAALFFILGLHLYLTYIKTPSYLNFAKLFFVYLLGLMSKPTAVTFPFVLCLIDVWPLERCEISLSFLKANYKRLIYEKLPFLIPLPLFAYLTVLAQKRAYAFAGFDKYPLDERLAGAVLAYARYLSQFLFPVKLTAFYPHLRNNYSVSILIMDIILLAALFMAGIMLWKKEKLYLTGYLWFLVNLAPVLGIIQVGGQASADRYMYIPMIGPLLIVVSGLFIISEKITVLKPKYLYLFFSIVFILFAAKSYYQSQVWKNSESLYANMVELSPNPSQGYFNMGLEHKNKGDFVKAEEYYRKAIEADPLNAQAYNNLGNALSQLNDISGANEAYKKACGLNAGHPVLEYNYGLSEELLGNNKKAEELYLKTLSLDRYHKESRIRLVYLLEKENRLDEALKNCDEGATLFKEDADFQVLKCSILKFHSRYEEARESSGKALERFPHDPNLLFVFGESCLNLGELDNAERSFLDVLNADPKSAAANYMLAEIRIRQNRLNEAVDCLKTASSLDPGNALYRNRLRDAQSRADAISGPRN